MKKFADIVMNLPLWNNTNIIYLKYFNKIVAT